jgi:hypothetical protein
MSNALLRSFSNLAARAIRRATEIRELLVYLPCDAHIIRLLRHTSFPHLAKCTLGDSSEACGFLSRHPNLVQIAIFPTHSTFARGASKPRLSFPHLTRLVVPTNYITSLSLNPPLRDVSILWLPCDNEERVVWALPDSVVTLANGVPDWKPVPGILVSLASRLCGLTSLRFDIHQSGNWKNDDWVGGLFSYA